MKEIENKFIEEVVECLKDEDVNIPYLILPLVQSIGNEKFDNFFEDLENHKNYSLCYEKDSTERDTSGSMFIYLPNYFYEIEFGFDVRDWGNCECEEGDIDYRADKYCCGHGCDWDAPTISLYKTEILLNHDFDGDEHDFWDFEDGYYKLDKETNEEKTHKCKSERITYLKTNIERMQAELADLA